MNYYIILLLTICSHSFAAHVSDIKLQAETKKEADAPIYVPTNLLPGAYVLPGIYDWLKADPRRINARIKFRGRDESLFSFADIYAPKLALFLLDHGYQETDPRELAGTVRLATGDKKRLPLLKKVFEMGTKTDLTDSQGKTALIFLLEDTSWFGQLEAIKLLISYGANVNYKNSKDFNKTPLMYILKVSDAGPNVVRTLLEHDADPNALDANGKSVTQYAQEAGKKEVEDLIAEYKNRYREAQKAHDTFIELGLPQDIGKVVAGHLVMPTKKQNIYQSIKQAIKNNDQQKLRDLISNKHNLELTDELGYTPLLLAVYDNKPEMVGFLLAQDADLKAATQGKNARQLAQQFGYKEVIEAIDKFVAQKKK